MWGERRAKSVKNGLMAHFLLFCSLAVLLNPGMFLALYEGPWIFFPMNFQSPSQESF